jgi:geranylgeranyl reductase family protein
VDLCDVLIVGGGPAGSSCARGLRAAGLDVVVIDRAAFPRDKVCAGWITPQVVDDLRLDLDDYRRGRTLQAITGFRTGLIDGASVLETVYERPISFGIRRCEFDHFLLQRSGARLRLGEPIARIRREGPSWIVNDAVRAPMLVGAGGHFCPVARAIAGPPTEGPVVAAQEAEFPIAERESSAFQISANQPELYFSRDLKGYGWCFRKQGYLNVGFGSLDRHALPKATATFTAFLERRGKVPAGGSWRWRGHAYLLSEPRRRRVTAEAALLVGDAAGLAYPQSGEGIRPAIESGLMAAAAIVEARGRYDRDRLAAYERRLRQRFAPPALARMVSSVLPPALSTSIAPSLFDNRWFVRHVLLDRWFLHAHEPALAA